MYLNPIESLSYSTYPCNTSGLPTSNYNNTNFICPAYRHYIQENYYSSSRLNKSTIGLSNSFRKLWEQHGAWTRMTIISMVFDLPDVEVVTNRLLQNPVGFANILKIYYGDKIASKFSDLLKDHLVIAAELVAAAKAGDTKTAADAEKRWYANADEIAAFLASINPYWYQESWKNMLYTSFYLYCDDNSAPSQFYFCKHFFKKSFFFRNS